jgi:Transposase IS66 family
VRSGFWSKC